MAYVKREPSDDDLEVAVVKPFQTSSSMPSHRFRSSSRSATPSRPRVELHPRRLPFKVDLPWQTLESRPSKIVAPSGSILHRATSFLHPPSDVRSGRTAPSKPPVPDRFAAYSYAQPTPNRPISKPLPTRQEPNGGSGTSPDIPGELSKKSRRVQNAKINGTYPEGLLGSCFETTGIVVGRSACVEVSHMLFDTGASSVFISSAAAQAARLKIYDCQPRRFTLADGSASVHSRYTTFELYIAGVHQTIHAFLEEGQSGHHMLIGMTAIKQFRGNPSFSYGPRKETRWYVSQDTTGQRRTQFALEEDSAVVLPTMRTFGYSEGLLRAQRKGETPSQRNSREILERHAARGRKLKHKHERRAGPLYK